MDIVDLDQIMEVHFQEGILTDILSRLPVRSLLRFKCVSRFWETLIDEPYFRMKHLNHAKNDENSQKFLFYQLRPQEDIFSIYCCPLSSSVQLVEDVRKLDCPLNFEPRYCTVYCCCDGLFIIRVYENIAERHILLLWNPSTGESIVLPTPKFPAEGFSCLGLSFDSTSGDYKILKINENENNSRKVPGAILALKSGSWRKIDEHPRVIHNMVSCMHSLAFIHGAFHWVGISRNYFVVSFNISHEVYGEMPLPEQICLMSKINIGISVLKGMICAYSNGYHQGNHTFRLWVMKDYGLKESWNAVFSIADPDIHIAAPKYMFADGEVLFWCLHLRCGENAFRTQRGPFTLLPRVASRRSSEELIFQGRVTVNGSVCKTPQTKVDPARDVIYVNGNRLPKKLPSKVYLALNKPKGYICSSGEKETKSVMSLFDDFIKSWDKRHPKQPKPRLFTVGRLDVATTGLIIVTNDGEFAHQISHPSSNLSKEYIATIDGEVHKRHLIAISEGTVIEGVHCSPDNVELLPRQPDLPRHRLRIVVHEGRNHEVRELVKNAGLQLRALKRIRIGGFRLPADLALGKHVELNQANLKALGWKS